MVMSRLQDRLAALVTNTETPTESPDTDADGRDSVDLYACPDCELTYIKDDMQSCPECGESVDPVPSFADVGIDPTDGT